MVDTADKAPIITLDAFHRAYSAWRDALVEADWQGLAYAPHNADDLFQMIVAECEHVTPPRDYRAPT